MRRFLLCASVLVAVLGAVALAQAKLGVEDYGKMMKANAQAAGAMNKAIGSGATKPGVGVMGMSPQMRAMVQASMFWGVGTQPLGDTLGPPSWMAQRHGARYPPPRPNPPPRVVASSATEKAALSRTTGQRPPQEKSESVFPFQFAAGLMAPGHSHPHKTGGIAQACG